MHPFSIALTLFVIMNPIGNIPIFLGLVGHYKLKRQRWVLTRELLFALAILYVFALFGAPLLDALHLDDNALGVGGGILLFLISLGLIFPKYSTTDDGKQEPFLVPIALPLTAGPGTLATVMLYSHAINLFEFLLVLTLTWAVAAAILIGSTWLTKIINEKVLLGIKRLGGFLLSLIAVDMVVRYLIKLIELHS